jgi:hypothetical protein
MLIIEHRVNGIDRADGYPTKLVDVPPEHGVEIDVRHDPATDRLYLSHDPLTAKKLESAAYLDDYFAVFAERKNTFAVLNIKEAGVEKRCIELARHYGIGPEKYFLLDVEFPFLYAATRGTRADGFLTRAIAVRYSEAEPIEMAFAQKGFVDWVWIDTNTMLPLDATTTPTLMQFKTCLVSPDRWRPDKAVIEIPAYRSQVEKLNFRLDAVMVGKEYVHLWK